MPRLLQPCATDPRLLSVCPDPRLIQGCDSAGPIVARYAISINQALFMNITWSGNCGGFCDSKGYVANPVETLPLDYRIAPYPPKLYGIDQWCEGGPSSVQQCDDGQTPQSECGTTNSCYRNRPGSGGGTLGHAGCLRVEALRNAAGAIYGFRLYGGFWVMLEKYVVFSEFPQDLWSDDRQATQSLDSCCWNLCLEGPTLSPVLYRELFGVQAYESQYTFWNENLCEHNELFEQIGFVNITVDIIPPPGEAPQSGYDSEFVALANQHPEWWRARVDLQWGGARGRATGYIAQNSGSVDGIIICGGNGSLPSLTFESGHAIQEFVPESLYTEGEIGQTAGEFSFTTTVYQRSGLIDIVPLDDPECDGYICPDNFFLFCPAKLYYRSDGPPRQSAGQWNGTDIGVSLGIELL